jgi:homogentisate 1,2-dioxygenase
LPLDQNTPQKFAYGLYPELLSGTAFTAPRESNRRSWLYRVLPSVAHEPFIEVDQKLIVSNWSNETRTPNQLKWKPFEIETEDQVDFVDVRNATFKK